MTVSYLTRDRTNDSKPTSQVHERPYCDTHGLFCLIFGNIAILTNSNTLISKIIVANLNSGVKVVLINKF